MNKSRPGTEVFIRRVIDSGHATKQAVGQGEKRKRKRNKEIKPQK